MTDFPLVYVGTDQAIADLFNANQSATPRKLIDGSELFGYTDETEYIALTDSQKSQWLSLCSIDAITAAAVPIIKNIFPANTTTWANIVKTEVQTRAEQLGIGFVEAPEITFARTGGYE